jgi:DNA adenine methylase
VATGRTLFSLSRLEPLLDAAHARLDGVVLENLDWSELVRRYDSSGSLFYLDPPYWGGEDDYGKDLFQRPDYARMAAQLADIEGAFVLSINDRPETRALFASFEIEAVSLKYSVSRGDATDAAELLISNRKPDDLLL